MGDVEGEHSGGTVDAVGPSMTLEQQVDYWQERYFALSDEHAELLNQLQAIQAILSGRGGSNG